MNYNDENMKTFNDLFNFLQSYSNNSIIDWLEQSWTGKDKQESLLRLFAGLGLIEKFKDFNICKGNFNLRTIQKQLTFKDIFYDNNKLIMR